MGRMMTVEQRVAVLAATDPERAAIVFLTRSDQPTTLTYRSLDRRADHCARVLAANGVRPSGLVVIALPNGIDHVVATIAAWRLGATVVPLDRHSPAKETEEVVATAKPQLFIGTPRQPVDCPVIAPAAWGVAESAEPLPAPDVAPRSALATGGTTGRPRVVFRRRAWRYDEDALPSAHDKAMGLAADQVQLVTMPMYHGGFGALHYGLALHHTIVLTPMFIPRLVLDAIERYSVEVLRVVPTMMKLLLDADDLGTRNLSSVVALHHGTAPCPPDLKRAWLELLGPDKVYETYSSQEQLGFVWIRGDEWLAHPGSVGRPEAGTVAIVDEHGEQAPAGMSGEVFTRPATGAQPEYLGEGSALTTWRDEYFSVGDLGRVDADGYLFVEGRLRETINVGGAKVQPPEVEAVLTSYPSVVDACVVARSHPISGQVPHAVVVSTDPALSLRELDRHCRERLSLHKVPATYEIVESLPRNEAGKLRRSLISPRAHQVVSGPGGPAAGSGLSR
jgi:bile acid-coenzyme A ligase